MIIYRRVSVMIVAILLCLLPLCCLVDEEDDTLSDSEEAIARSVATMYSFTFKALQSRDMYGQENGASKTYLQTACPTIHWWDACNWIIDFGDGCTASDGNYYSGSITAVSCQELHYSQFCQNEYCIDGEISFSSDVDCDADQCYQQIVDATFSGPEDTVTIYQNAVAGVTGTTYYLFAPSNLSVTSQVHGSYSSAVQVTLRRDRTECPFPTVGIVYITVTGHDPITIDFNTGDCYTAFVNGIETDLTEKQ
ncbi:hypothetical protein ACFL27_00825 [candidate division CSSED10-310 bacterium]|uniref:Uncharacterized protein n=1 Tax=candidate division CSSED10-310 bacterium TaxID=2855610 RepID=A0ABV6YR93_UNCC1